MDGCPVFTTHSQSDWQCDGAAFDASLANGDGSEKANDGGGAEQSPDGMESVPFDD